MILLLIIAGIVYAAFFAFTTGCAHGYERGRREGYAQARRELWREVSR